MKQSKYAHKNTQTTPSGIRSLEHKRAISTCSTTCHHAQVSSGLAGGASTHSSRVIQHGQSGFKFTHDALDARNVCARTHTSQASGGASRTTHPISRANDQHRARVRTSIHPSVHLRSVTEAHHTTRSTHYHTLSEPTNAGARKL